MTLRPLMFCAIAALLLPACEGEDGGGGEIPDALLRADADVRSDSAIETDATPEIEPDVGEDPVDAGPDPVDSAPDPVDGAPDGAIDDGDAEPDPELDAAPDPDAGPDPEPPMDADPDTVGPFEVTIDEARVDIGPRGGLPEAVDVTVYAPDAAGPHPLVVFNHGFSLPPSAYADYGNRLASHGIVTVMPLYDDNPFAARSHLGLAEDTIAVIDWALDALDGLVDPDAIGLTGHSRGGKHAVHAAVLDDRVGALLGLDPVDSAPPFAIDPVQFPSVAPELVGQLGIPSAFAGAGRGAEGFMACAPAGENFQSFYDAAPAPSALYLMPQAGHQDFVDTCAAGSQDLTCTLCPNGGISGDVHDFAVTLTAAFFRVHLAGDAGDLPWLDGAAVDQLMFVERVARE